MQKQESAPVSVTETVEPEISETRTSKRLSQPTPRARRASKIISDIAHTTPSVIDTPITLSKEGGEKLAKSIGSLADTDSEKKRRSRLSREAGGDGHVEDKKLRELSEPQKEILVKTAASWTATKTERALEKNRPRNQKKSEGLEIVPPNQSPEESKRWVNVPRAKPEAPVSKQRPPANKQNRLPRQEQKLHQQKPTEAAVVEIKPTIPTPAPHPASPVSLKPERKSFGPEEFGAAIEQSKRLGDIYTALRRIERTLKEIGGQTPKLIMENIASVQRGQMPIEDVPREFGLQKTVGRILQEILVSTAKQKVETHYAKNKKTPPPSIEENRKAVDAVISSPIENKSGGIWSWIGRIFGR